MYRMKQVMEKLGAYARVHWMVLLLAVVTSCIVASPQIAFRIDHRDDGIYQGIELLPDSFWSPRVREVQDGYFNFGSMYWKEGKDLPYLFQPLGSASVAYLGSIFGLDINNTLLLSRFVVPFVTVLLIYTFVFLVSRNMYAALASAAVIILANDILDPRGLSTFLQGSSPVSFLVFGQPVVPGMVQMPLFAFLVSFWLFITRKTWLLGVLSAVLLGLNFYNYFYLWTYLYAVGGLLTLFFALKKNFQDAIRVVCVLIGGLFVGAWYIVNLYQVTQHPLYEELSTRIGILYTHAPLSVGVVVLASIVIFFLLYPREDRTRYMFSLALLLAPFVTLNQQLITGKIMQAGHYHYYLHKPIAVILVLIAVYAYFERHKFWIYRRALTAFLVVVSIGIGVFIQIDSYYHDTVHGGAVAVERQKYGPVMKWLETNAPKDSVVFANDEISQLVTIYTPQNVFYHRGVSYSSLGATKERLLDMIFTFYRLRGVGYDDAPALFYDERDKISMDLYHVHFQESLGSPDAISESILDEVIDKYQKTFVFSTDAYLKAMWDTYDVEYVVWDKRADPDWKFDAYPFGDSVVTFGDISVYYRASSE